MTVYRTVSNVVVEVTSPAIDRGVPTVPQHWAQFPATATLKQGPLHIHAIADPNPIWNPATSGWYTPPPPLAGVGDIRWSVNTLPDPATFPGGWYWLGDPSSSDNTAGIEAAAQQWNADPGAPGPAFRSFYPFKPSVSALDAYIPGERSIHHPKGVHFNSHFIEHMWLDLGGNAPQPFTWIIAAMVMSDPSPGYSHNLLAAGRNPDSVGFPRISASDTSAPRLIADNLPYQSALQVQSQAAAMRTGGLRAQLRTPGAPGVHPSMYAAVFNGAKSTLTVQDPFGMHASVGTVQNGAGFAHRFFAVGREQGYMAQSHASNVLVFEMRYWRRALGAAEVAEQYAQLSSTYQFDLYRRL